MVPSVQDRSWTLQRFIDDSIRIETAAYIVPGSPIDSLAPGNSETLELTTPSGCALGKPTALVFAYTGDACRAASNLQEGSFECAETDPLGDLVRVEMTEDRKIVMS